MRRYDDNLTEEQRRDGIGAALGRIPAGIFILTAKHEDRASGIIASWVQQASFSPPMVSVAVAKGRPIMPLISESRAFGLCQLPQGEKTAMRKFAGGVNPNEDPFLGMELIPHTVTHTPILAHCLAYLECEVKCHIDVEGDHDLFVGTVLSGRLIGGEPWVHLRDSGYKY